MERTITETTYYIDNTTGEVLSSETKESFQHWTKPKKSLDFCIVFIEPYLKTFCGDTSSVNSRVLWELMKQATYVDEITGGCLVAATGRVREIMAQNANISMSSFNKAITQLIKKDVIRPYGRGNYVINPNVLGKGKLKNLTDATITWNKGTIEMSRTTKDPITGEKITEKLVQEKDETEI